MVATRTCCGCVCARRRRAERVCLRRVQGGGARLPAGFTRAPGRSPGRCRRAARARPSCVVPACSTAIMAAAWKARTPHCLHVRRARVCPRVRLTRAGRQRATAEDRRVDCCSCATRTPRSAVSNAARRRDRPRRSLRCRLPRKTSRRVWAVLSVLESTGVSGCARRTASCGCTSQSPAGLSCRATLSAAHGRLTTAQRLVRSYIPSTHTQVTPFRAPSEAKVTGTVRWSAQPRSRHFEKGYRRQRGRSDRYRRLDTSPCCSPPPIEM